MEANKATRFGFGMKMWDGAPLSFKDVFSAQDESEAKSKVGAWASYHGYAGRDVELMPIPAYAEAYASAEYMERF